MEGAFAESAAEILVAEHAEKTDEKLVVAGFVHLVDQKNNFAVHFRNEIADGVREGFKVFNIG